MRHLFAERPLTLRTGGKKGRIWGHKSSRERNERFGSNSAAVADATDLQGIGEELENVPKEESSLARARLYASIERAIVVVKQVNNVSVQETRHSLFPVGRMLRQIWALYPLWWLLVQAVPHLHQPLPPLPSWWQWSKRVRAVRDLFATEITASLSFLSDAPVRQTPSPLPQGYVTLIETGFLVLLAAQQEGVIDLTGPVPVTFPLYQYTTYPTYVAHLVRMARVLPEHGPRLSLRKRVAGVWQVIRWGTYTRSTS